MNALSRLFTYEGVVSLACFALCLVQFFILFDFEQEFRHALYVYGLDTHIFRQADPVFWIIPDSGQPDIAIMSQQGSLHIENHVTATHHLILLYLLACAFVQSTNGHIDRIVPVFAILTLGSLAIFSVVYAVGTERQTMHGLAENSIYALLLMGSVQGLIYCFYLPRMDLGEAAINSFLSFLFLFTGLSFWWITSCNSQALQLDVKKQVLDVKYDGFFSSYTSKIEFSDIRRLQWRYQRVEEYGTTWVWALYTTEYEGSSATDVATNPEDGVVLSTIRTTINKEPDIESHRALCEAIAGRVGAVCLPSIEMPAATW